MQVSHQFLVALFQAGIQGFRLLPSLTLSLKHMASGVAMGREEWWVVQEISGVCVGGGRVVAEPTNIVGM